jgi:hypothetical protein
VVQRLNAPQRRRRDARGAPYRYTLVVEVALDVYRAAVVLVRETLRHGIRPAIGVAAAVRAPVDLHDQVVRTVVIERSIEVEAEPRVRRGRDVLRALAVNQYGRVAAVVGREVVGEGRAFRVAATQLEVVVRPRTAGVRVPLPFRNGPRRNGVTRQNQSLAPYRVDASTSPERVRAIRVRAAYRNRGREGRTGHEHAGAPYEHKFHGNASLVITLSSNWQYVSCIFIIIAAEIIVNKKNNLI